MRSTRKRFEYYTDGGLMWFGTPKHWVPVLGTLPRFEWFLMEWL